MATSRRSSLSRMAAMLRQPSVDPHLVQAASASTTKVDRNAKTFAMSSINDLISRFPVLCKLASFLSTLDLYHLALTCRANNAHILSTRRIFDVLKRDCLCEGHGLAQRQDFAGLYSLQDRRYQWGDLQRIWQDEPIEVQLYRTKCDQNDVLPCRKCGINVCEECRYYPRVPPLEGYPERRPHLNAPNSLNNIMCLCEGCDAKLEGQLEGKFLSALCDCDLFTRWICGKCVEEERDFTYDYEAEHTVLEGNGPTKNMIDHQFERAMYCLCGANVPADTRPRCTWCKRRHLPEKDWGHEWEVIGRKMPIFDNDLCYPRFSRDIYANGRPYPKLGYEGPIWKVFETHSA